MILGGYGEGHRHGLQTVQLGHHTACAHRL
jgi:hypothetical protein